MNEALWQRAALLFNQQRWDLAERELRQLLANEPEHVDAHALLAIVLSQAGDLDEAAQEARTAIQLDPEHDGAYRAMATVHLERDEGDQALAAIGRAVELDPYLVAHRSMQAQVLLGMKRWQQALDAADAGLTIDPEDTDCLNIRSLALARLGRGDEAQDTLDASLAHDPDNPYTHQARGFALLQRGDSRQALHHFQEALRRDPTLEGARAGLVEALKARNPIYRYVLAWFLWLERFPAEKQRQILIGMWLAALLGRRSLVAAGYETAAEVVSFSWMGFALLTYCTVPLFNLLLLLHPVGRHALDRGSRNHALLLGAAMAMTIAMFVAQATGDQLWTNRSRWFWLFYLMPIAGLGLFESGWGKRVMQAVCALLPLVWVAFVVGVVGVQADVEALRAAPGADAQERMAAIQTTAERLGGLMTAATWATVLSTWFVLLGPKGRRPRRRR